MLNIFLFSLACSQGCTQSDDQPGSIRHHTGRRTSIDNIEAVSASDVAFALDLWAELDTKDNNQFISPYSMTSALGMLHLRAAGNSDEEMKAVLNIDEDDAAWHGTKGLLTQELHQQSDVTISVDCNRLFAQNGCPSNQFLEEVDSIYGAPVQTVDFQVDAEGGRQEVNAWVSDQTKGHIPELFKAGTINEATRLVLANAIYLNTLGNTF